MSSGSGITSYLMKPSQNFPFDLAGIVLLLIISYITTTLGTWVRPLRIVFGFVIIVFIPGYAIVSALFPRKHDPETDSSEYANVTGTDLSSPLPRHSITFSERVVFSFATSIAVAVLVGFVLGHLIDGITFISTLLALSGITVSAAVVAGVRRRNLPPERQFSPPYEQSIRGVREFLQPISRIDAILSILLVCSIIVLVASVFFVGWESDQEGFTQFYLLTENESGDLVAEDYPTEFIEGERQPLYIGVENHEARSVNYTVVVKQQTVERQANNVQVLTDREIHRFHSRVVTNDRWVKEHEIEGNQAEQNIRIVYLLYIGEPPENPTIENAYRELHLWATVTEPNESARQSSGDPS